MADIYSLSDRLGRVKTAFSQCERTGLKMAPEAVAKMGEVIASLEADARALENEISRHRWNAAAQRDRLEAGIASGKVEIFPVVARPAPHPDGGAA